MPSSYLGSARRINCHARRARSMALRENLQKEQNKTRVSNFLRCPFPTTNGQGMHTECAGERDLSHAEFCAPLDKVERKGGFSFHVVLLFHHISLGGADAYKRLTKHRGRPLANLRRGGWPSWPIANKLNGQRSGA